MTNVWYTQMILKVCINTVPEFCAVYTCFKGTADVSCLSAPCRFWELYSRCAQFSGQHGCSGAGTPFRQIFLSRSGAPINMVYHSWNADTEAFWPITSYYEKVTLYTKFGLLVLRKIIEIGCHWMSYFKAKMHQM